MFLLLVAATFAIVAPVIEGVAVVGAAFVVAFWLFLFLVNVTPVGTLYQSAYDK